MPRTPRHRKARTALPVQAGSELLRAGGQAHPTRILAARAALPIPQRPRAELAAGTAVTEKAVTEAPPSRRARQGTTEGAEAKREACRRASSRSTRMGRGSEP